MHSLKTLGSIDVKDEGFSKITCFKHMHPLKAFSSIEITEVGIVISVNEMHLKKASNPIDFTEDGMSICSNDWQ